MIPEIGVKFEGIATGKLRRYFSLKNIVDIFKIPIGIVQAFMLLRKFKPQVVGGILENECSDLLKDFFAKTRAC